MLQANHDEGAGVGALKTPTPIKPFSMMTIPLVIHPMQ
jgi:hypothetical protein